MQHEYDITVRWRAFPLHPEVPEEGQSLVDLFRTSPEKIAGILNNLQTKAAELGLPFGPREKTFNSRLAQELGMWATAKGRGEAFHLATFKAYFARGLNIGSTKVLLEIIRELGLPETEAARVLTGRLYKDPVDRDWQESRLRGITAVPTFVMGQHRLVGAQSYQDLVEMVRMSGAGEKNP